jgi:transcriptional regulator with XRE-family HTH domain
VDPSRVLRDARQHAGLSQRALAARAGVAVRTVAAAESSARTPSWSVVQALLAACGLALQVVEACPPVRGGPACRHVVEHLRLSLTERWRRAAERTGRAEALGVALGEASRRGAVVLESTAAASLWTPDVELSLPVVVHVHRPWFVPPETWRPPTPDPAVLAVRVQAGEPSPGLVRVRATETVDVHAAAAPALTRDPCCRLWWPALQAASAALHEQAATDGAGRRPPAHRQSDEEDEAWRLGQALRYIGGPLPSAADSRAFRLDAPVSLPPWLSERGLPALRGQRERW